MRIVISWFKFELWDFVNFLEKIWFFFKRIKKMLDDFLLVFFNFMFVLYMK